MNLKQKTFRGLKWSFISRFGLQASQSVILVILARLLGPRDFGLVGMVTVITGLALIFGDLGIGRTLIYKQDLKDAHLSSAFWVNVGLGLALTAILVFSASTLEAFYRQPGLKVLFIALSFNFILSSFTIVQEALLMKEMDFKRLAIRNIAATIVAGIIGIICALFGFGVWSLVVQSLTRTFVCGIFLWFFSPWRPTFSFSSQAFGELLHYSSNVTGFEIFTYFARNVDYLLIGFFLGPRALGLYTLAYKFMLLPLNNVTWTATKVMFPAFSQIQDDLPRVRNVYLRMIKYISLVTFPFMCGLFVLAPEFIRTVYGNKWGAVVPLVQVMCFCGMLQSIYSSSGSLFLSQGKSRQLFVLTVYNCLVVVVSVLIGLHWGILGVAISYTTCQAGWFIVVQTLSNRVIGLNNRLFLSTLARNTLFSFALLASMGLLKLLLRSMTPVFILCAVGLFGISLYLLFIFFFEKNFLRQLLGTWRS